MTQIKLKAFTLSELLVVMVVTSILLSSALLIYDNVSRYQIRMRTRVEQVNALNRLQLFMLRDLRKHTNLEKKQNLLVGGKDLRYEFYTDSVVRYQRGLTETFPIGSVLEEGKAGLSLEVLLYQQNLKLRLPERTDYLSQWKEVHSK